MTLQSFKKYCSSKPGVTKDFPFDESVMVFKVMGKIFTLGNIFDFTSINLKCEPELALKLRKRHPEVKPGYHMNKKHWNTVELNGKLTEKQIKEQIDHSYDQVVQKLTKAQKEKLSQL